MQSIQELPIEKKRVLIRVDFNVPMQEGVITDSTRIDAAMKTIQHALSREAKVIVMSHRGRPKGKKDPSLSLKPCADYLRKKLPCPVYMASDCIGKDVENSVREMKEGELLVLENLRFYSEETEKKDMEKQKSFAQKLAQLADFFVNDAFGNAHRFHASNASICSFFHGKCAFGFLMQDELRFIKAQLDTPLHPFYAIIGGAKVSTKLSMLRALLDKVDGLAVVGAMAFTFLKAQGYKVGKSLVEDELLEEASRVIQSFKEKKIPLLIPFDFLCAKEVSQEAETKYIDLCVEKEIPSPWMGLDLGEKSLEAIRKMVKMSDCIFWNGPAGVFEVPLFAKGTKAIASIISELETLSIVGGGDSVAAVKELGFEKLFTHLSTGGGACLELIEKGTLPSIQALEKESKTSLGSI